jgi:hypothetical protein
MYDFKEKEVNIRQLNNYMLAKTLSMFEYDGLPESIPYNELEYLLQVNGYAFITKVNGELYALSGSIGGEVDAYNRPTQITINNIALKFNKTLSLKDDGILIKNDDMSIGLIPMYEKHHTMLIENDINMTIHGYNTRIKTLISASDDKTKTSAENYLKKVIDGEIGVIGENAFFEGVRSQAASHGAGTNITSLTEFHQYIKGSLYNEIGLSSNFNMKRERLISAEVDQSEDSLFPYVYNMMKCRLKAIEAMNEKYDLKCEVDFGSVWHFKNRQLVDDVVTDDIPLEATETTATTATTATTNEPSNEPLNEPLNEPFTNHNEPLETPTNENTGESENETNDNTSEPLPDTNAIPEPSTATDNVLNDASSIDELMDMLKEDDLSEDDIEAINALIDELKDKEDA